MTQAATNFLAQTVAGLGAAPPYYFGTANLGSLRGLTQSVVVASTAVGPILLSLAHQWAGSYRPGLMGLALLCAVVAVAVLFARRPRPRSHQGTPVPDDEEDPKNGEEAGGPPARD